MSTSPAHAAANSSKLRLSEPDNSRWTDCLRSRGLDKPPRAPAKEVLIGAINGEGIGSEVVTAALRVVKAVVEVARVPMEVEFGGRIGRDAEKTSGTVLPQPVIDFCSHIFFSNGAVLCGPGGGRFVYDIRREFDLFFKISPLCARHGLAEVSRIKPEWLKKMDILLIRENTEGLYQGNWERNGGLASHSFSYSEEGVMRFLTAAARLALQRGGRLTVVWKEAGTPSISGLWRECAEAVCSSVGVTHSMIDIDLMAYRLVQEPDAFDVVASPNMFGDVLGDLGAVLLGSRGISFSGNYSADGKSVYQTNHGAAYNIAGNDAANPAGQILSGAMMLKESFGLHLPARAVEQAVANVWARDVRTLDVATPSSRIVGTAEMAGLIAAEAANILSCADSAA